ncbi:hypothetical protein FOL47_011117 [Perkinsus chesapeaki]|uniref:Uncharacterized protein n=1 Tax=Perkinsus chesapeaki TaxID=330153 RepID=A0A7J6MN79_PERCH|nr:hypothetical protein FOL47_011117 [Perkinsus chesapeaki]
MNVQTSKGQVRTQEKEWSLYGKGCCMLFLLGMMLTMLGYVGGFRDPPPMPRNGLYTGLSNRYFFRWFLHDFDAEPLMGRVYIHAIEYNVIYPREFNASGILYWRGGPPRYPIELNRSDDGLVNLSRNLGMDPLDWHGFDHGSDWIELFGGRLRYRKYPPDDI